MERNPNFTYYEYSDENLEMAQTIFKAYIKSFQEFTKEKNGVNLGFKVIQQRNDSWREGGFFFKVLKDHPETEPLAVQLAEELVNWGYAEYDGDFEFNGEMPFGMYLLGKLAEHNPKHIHYLIKFMEGDDLNHPNEHYYVIRDVLNASDWCEEAIDLAVACSIIPGQRGCDQVAECVDDTFRSEVIFNQYLKKLTEKHYIDLSRISTRFTNWKQVEYEIPYLFMIMENVFEGADGEALEEVYFKLVFDGVMPTYQLLKDAI